MSTKSLLKSSGIISAATAVSRVLGFIRDILVARFFGTGASIEAFFVAFRIPNLLRHIVAEGAANSAFVPVLSEHLVTKSKEDYWQVVNVLFNIVLICLTCIVIIGIFAAPFIVRIVAPGFSADEKLILLAIKLTRIIFPYILLIGMAAYFMGILNSLKHFSVPAFAPIFLNISIITAILIFYRNVTVMHLAFAVLIGGVFQLLVQIPVLYAKGMRFGFPATLRHPVVKKIGKLLFPRVLGTAVYQLNVLVDTMLASFYTIVGAGGIAALWYAYRLIQLPTAVFGTSLAMASLPTLSQYYARDEMDKFKKTISFLLRAFFLIIIPATAGFIILGSHIIRIIFQGGAFTAYSTAITNTALLFNSFGLFSYAGIRIMVFSFYSMQDTVTPVKTASIALVINIVLNLILMWPLKIGGLALATSIAGIFNFSALLYILRKRIGNFSGEYMALFLFKIILAVLLMAGVLYFGLDKFNTFIRARGFAFSIGALFLYILIGIGVYLTALYALRVKELGTFAKWILKKR